MLDLDPKLSARACPKRDAAREPRASLTVDGARVVRVPSTASMMGRTYTGADGLCGFGRRHARPARGVGIFVSH